ncbi:MAG: PF20097 family protein [Chloroflexota bacterium]
MTIPGNDDPVLCPICGGTAEKGYLLGSGRNYAFTWHPGQPTWWNRLKAGFSTGVRVGEFGGFFGAWADAVYCEECQRVTLEVTDIRKKYYPYLKE